jgi:hypothetical protein
VNQENQVHKSYSQSVKGRINFAADRIEGISLAKQQLSPVQVEVSNIRTLARKATLENEGFVLVEHPRGRGDWTNHAWVNGEYVQSCVDLVKRLTGAKTAFEIGCPRHRHSGKEKPKIYDKTYGGVATYVHIDLTREMAWELARHAAERQRVKMGRGAMYNVWKTHSPPPQDLPLTVSDWRTIPVHDQITRVFDEDESPVKSVGVAYTPNESKWYYAPDMNADESLVFVGADLDPRHPLGCAHSAFAPGWPDAHPRVSVEVRVLAFFE